MSTGGLMGAGGGSLAGTTPPPPAKQPDSASLASYAQAGLLKPENSKGPGGGKTDAETKARHDGDGWAQSEDQSQKLQEFDAVRGRPSLGEEAGGKQRSQDDNESAFDVVRRADKGAAEAVYGAAKEAIGTVNDAAGAVLHGAIGWTGIDAFEGHAERNQARGEGMAKVITSPVETAREAVEAIKTEAGEAVDEWEAGRYGDLAERGGRLAGGAAVGVLGGGVATKVLRRGDGPGGPNVADTPIDKKEAQDVGKSEKPEGGSPTYDFSKVNDKVSVQKQNRHVEGRPEWANGKQGGYLKSVDEAQSVLDAARSGDAEVLGANKQGFPIVRHEGVTGYNNNPDNGFLDQPTNVFLIKGTEKPSVVPMNPNWGK